MIYLAFLKRAWPFIVGALLLWASYAWHAGRVKDAYDEGVKVTEDAQAEVIAKRLLENEKQAQAVAIESARIQTELEGKANANEIIANNLRDQLRTTRVCFSDEVRRRPVPETTGPAAGTSAAPVNPGPVETVGSRVVEIIEACQLTTDRFIGWQKYWKSR